LGVNRVPDVVGHGLATVLDVVAVPGGRVEDRTGLRAAQLGPRVVLGLGVVDEDAVHEVAHSPCLPYFRWSSTSANSRSSRSRSNAASGSGSNSSSGSRSGLRRSLSAPSG